jgi:hypothetical protein
MMERDLSRAMGQQDEAIGTLKSEVALLRKDVAEIRDMLAENRGGIRWTMAIAGLAASIGAAIEMAVKVIFK